MNERASFSVGHVCQRKPEMYFFSIAATSRLGWKTRIHYLNIDIEYHNTNFGDRNFGNLYM